MIGNPRSLPYRGILVTFWQPTAGTPPICRDRTDSDGAYSQSGQRANQENYPITKNTGFKGRQPGSDVKKESRVRSWRTVPGSVLTERIGPTLSCTDSIDAVHEAVTTLLLISTCCVSCLRKLRLAR